VLREALRRMGRADLIGGSKLHLIPPWQPAGTGLGEGHRGRIQPGVALTQHTGLPPRAGVSPRVGTKPRKQRPKTR
jgi:hypothetical protein